MRARNFSFAIALILVSIKSFAQTHTVTSFLPTVASESETVTITGTQFTGVTAVSFGGTPAESFIVESSGTITAVVGSGSSGSVSVTKADGTVALAGFTYVLVPYVASLSPASAATGASVTITGLNFAATPANNIVFFGAGKANVTAASSTELTVTLPVGATYGPVTVIVNGRMGFSSKPFLPTFTGGNGLVSGTFGPRTDFATGSLAQTVAVGDLNGDGKSDVVITNEGDHSIGIYRNTSTGPGNTSFATRLDISTESNSGPYSIAMGDLDGDGKQDIVVTRKQLSSVSVFRNASPGDGTISFAALASFTTLLTPYWVAISDLDLDGKPDLAVANANSASVSILRSTSTGVGNIDFATKVDFATASDPRGLAIGDLDGDGKPDLAVACTGGGKISVLRNDSDGKGDISFEAKLDYSLTSPYAVAIGDFNANGTNDIAAAGFVGDVAIFRYNGTGPGNISYAAKFDVAVSAPGPNRQGITAGDMDGDGKLDLIAANTSNPGAAEVFRNTHTGGNTMSFAAGVAYTTEQNAGTVVVGDMDGDGKGDLIASTQLGFLSVLLNHGDITAPVVTVLSPLDNATGFAANSNLVLTFSEDVIKGSGNIVILENGDPTQTININTASVTIAGNVVTVDPSDFTADAEVNIQIASGAFTDLAGNDYGGIADPTAWNFTVAPAPPPVPTVTSFTPTSAAAGATVTITGTNFDDATAVSFGGTPATSFNIESTSSITAVVAGGSSGVVSVTAPGGTATLAGFTFYPAPTLTSFNPTIGPAGTSITLTGTNFTGTTSVTFGGTEAASFNVVSPTSITAVLGSGSSGNVSVTTPGGIASLAGFVIIAPPAISSFNPTSAGPGITVTLTGTNFVGATSVTFGGTEAASFNVVSPTSVTAVVSTGTSGDVSITTSGGTSDLSGFTFVPAPTLSSFIPTSAGAGVTVTLTGTDFTGATAVSFGGTAATSFNVVSPTSITAVVASGTSGNVSVTTPGGSISLAGFTFILPTAITNFNPNSGPVGTTVTLTGTNYSTTPANNLVKFNGVTATIVGTPTITTIVTTVPAGATTGAITVEVGGDVGTSATNFTVTAPDAPTVTAFDPLVGQIGATVTITGTNFSTTVLDNTVRFNGVTATIAGTPSTTSIVVTVPAGATTGVISVDVSGQLATSSTNFIVAHVPIIAGFTPESGAEGSTVTISGSGFALTHSDNIVYFGATKANVTAGTTTSLTVTVPPGATFQPISVLAYGLTGFSFKPFLPTFTGGNGIVAGTFAPKVDIATGNLSQSVAVGDLDGDGKADVVVSMQDENSIGILRNTSTGTGNTSFAALEEISTGANSAPNSVAIGDFDGDGKPDVVVARQFSASVSVFHNTSTGPGSITFDAERQDFPTGTNPFWVAISDFDVDGRLDLAVANAGSASVSILRGTSTGADSIGFAAKIDFTTADNPRHVAIGDLDGDGRPDVVAACTDGLATSVLRNSSSGVGNVNFASKLDFAGVKPYSVAIGDLNGNGTADLAVVNYSGNTVSTFRYNGSGVGNISYATKVDFATGNNPTSVTMGDLDGDGKIDLAVANQSSQSVSVLRNTNNGTNVISFAGHETFATAQNPSVAAIADLDGDGRSDLVVSTQFSFMSVLLNKGDVTAPLATAFSPLDDAGSVSTTSGMSITFDKNMAKGTGNILVREQGNITQTIDVTSANVTVSGTVVTINPSDFTQGVTVSIEITTGALTDLAGNDYAGIADATTWNFDVAGVAPPAPTVTGFDPTTSATGGTVTITGTNFTGATAVSFGGIAATSFNIVSAASITAVVAAGASGEVSVTTPGGTATLNGFTFLPPPTLTSFDPASAPAGATVTLTGTNFTGATAVSFGGTAATSFNVVSATSITAVIATGASGLVSVTTPDGTGTLAGFTFIPPPSITGFTPNSGPIGTSVTITGAGFSTTTSDNKVSFNGVIATITGTPTTTSIIASVPVGATTGLITVEIDGQLGTSSSDFTVTPPNSPTISGFNPISGPVGTPVIITGTNFSTTTVDNIVKFNGIAATITGTPTATSIVTTVPVGATTGVITVEVNAQVATSASDFTVTSPTSPTVSGFNPVSGPVGTAVTITGSNFSTTSSDNIVKFNGVVATITGTPTSTSIVTTVPVGATTGVVTVEVNAQIATSANAFTVTPPNSPTVSGFNPVSGLVGTSVTITGTNFSTTAGNNIVKFNGVVAAITGTPTATSIVTAVPASATTGVITVEVGGQVATSSSDFTVTPAIVIPTISAISPGSGPVGTSVTITGTDFSTTAGNNIVKFNGTVATVTGTPAATSIITVVPIGATSGKITVEVAGQTATSANDFTVTTVSLVQITNVTAPVTFTKGSAMTVSVTVNDATKVTSAILVTRGISQSLSDAKTAVLTAVGNKYEKLIPVEDLNDPIGLVYYFNLVDLNDVEITSTVANAYPVFSNSSTEQELPGVSFGTQVSNYQIIAFPFQFTNNAATAVLGALGSYDKTKWRLFDFAGGDNREYPAFNTIDPGKGYWLIVRNSTTINPGAGQTVAAGTTPFSIPISAGWNLIGNPYNFRISWDDVLAANTDITGLGNKVQVFSGGTLTESSVIDKFRGAFVFSGAAGTLEIPVTRNTTIGGRTNDEPAGRFALDQPYWEVPLMLTDGTLSNELGGIGMHPNATLTGKDEFDEVTVPLPDGLTLFGLATPHPELHATFSREVVPTTENFKWNFDVKGTAGKQVVIRWDNSYFGDNDKELVLFDPASMQLIDMRTVNHLALTDRMTNITVLFGSRDFIDKEMDEQLPLLGTPYPVPAQAEVTIPFRVPKSAGWAKVNMRIYDAKGVLVNTPVDKDMEPGHYEVKCQPTGTGMYIVRMEIAGMPSQLAKIIIY